MTRVGISAGERFTSDEFRVFSQSYKCQHGKHYEVVLLTRECGHEKVIAHTHSYREHWAQMYKASEHFILNHLPRSSNETE